MDLEPLAFLGHKPPSVTGNHFHLYRVAICTISTSMIMLNNFVKFRQFINFMTVFFEHSSEFLTANLHGLASSRGQIIAAHFWKFPHFSGAKIELKLSKFNRGR